MPTYDSVLRYGGTRFKDVGADYFTLWDVCIDECDRLADGARTLCGTSCASGGKPKKLKRVALGAFFGEQKEHWGENTSIEPDNPNRLSNSRAARKLLDGLYNHTQLESTCMHIGAGPLTIPSILYNEANYPPKLRMGAKGTTVPEKPSAV